MRTALTPRARHSASGRSQSWRGQPAKRARVCVRLTCVVAAAASQLQWTRQSSIVLLTEQVDIVLNLREVLACCCFCCCAVLLLYSRLCRGVCRLRGGRCRSAVKRLHRLASHRCTGHFGMSLATYESTTHHPHQGGKPLGRVIRRVAPEAWPVRCHRSIAKQESATIPRRRSRAAASTCG